MQFQYSIMDMLAFSLIFTMLVMSSSGSELKGHGTPSPKLAANEYRHVAKWAHGSRGSIPPNAIDVGTDGSNVVYICRVSHQNEVLPGKLLPETKLCYVSSKGIQLTKHEYEVLVPLPGVNVGWKSFSESVIPSGIIQGGNTAGGDPLYIGRAVHDNVVNIGKVQLNYGYMYAPYDNKDHIYTQFDILVVKSFNLV